MCGMNARELLVETFAYIPPARALEHLTAEDAERRVSGASHSIAEIVAHADFWQRWFCQRCNGTPEPMVTSAAMGWPEVVPGSWPDLRSQFLDGLERVVALAEPRERLDEPITPAIDFPPLAHFTIRDAIVHIASHNAHHLGQIILLEQMQGLWPPPSGSLTW
jgi:uncharacterized damage-inducible protein DinB